MVLPYGCIDLIFRKDKLEKIKSGLSEEIIKENKVSSAHIDENLILIACAMSYWEAEETAKEFEKEYGLTYLKNNKAVDFVLVESMKGLCAKCEWIKPDHLKEELIIDNMRYPKGTIYYEFIEQKEFIW